MRIVGILLLLLLALQGCARKGALFMPVKPAVPQAVPDEKVQDQSGQEVQR